MPSSNMKPDDRVRLRHMLDAALEIQQYVQASKPEDLTQDRKLVHSLVRLLEIIGEAAYQMNPDARAEVSGLPWDKVIAMRHRLVHAYFDINLDILWTTVKEGLPPLITAIEQLALNSVD